MKTQWYHFLALGIAIVLLVGFLYLVRGILPPFLIAFAVGWLLDPLLDRLQRRGLRRIYAVSSVYVLFLILFVVGIIFLVPPTVDQAKQLADDLPAYSERFQAFAADLMEKHRPLLVKFRLPTTLQEAFAKYGARAGESIKSGVNLIASFIISNLSKALWVILIPLVAFYFLNDIDRMRRKAAVFIPERWRDRTTEILSRVGVVFSSYVRGLVIVCVLYGIVTTIILTALNLKYGIILGLLAGILYAVPYLGAIVTTLLVFLIGLATYQHAIAQASIAAVSMVAANQVFDLVITPRILGKSVGLHPVLSIFALMVGADLFGLVGMVLAVPVAASIQEVVFEFYPQLRTPAREKPKPRTSRRRKKDSPERKASGSDT